MATIPTVVNFDTNRIPVEGSATFRADASYVWSTLPTVIDSMNTAIAAQNTVRDEIEVFKNSAASSANTAQGYKDETLQAKTDVETMKAEVAAMEEHVEGINDGIDSAIADAVEAQMGEFTEKINKNSTKIKMQTFGLNLL